jgi:hypothetical protein
VHQQQKLQPQHQRQQQWLIPSARSCRPGRCPGRCLC